MKYDPMDAELDAELQRPERTVHARRVIPGLLEDIGIEELTSTVERIISTQAAGEALSQARHQRELSLREAGQMSGRSAPRIKAIEGTGTDIHLGTVVEHAQALGYAVHLSLTPLNGLGPMIQADLSGRELNDKPQTDATWSSEVVLPVVRKKGQVKIK